jgi:Ca2+-binding EF-hand superfamily protein
MPLAALILPLLALAAQAEPPITVTARPWAPFISPMGEPFRARTTADNTLALWFNQADRNRDGALTPDEMQADAERFFATLDTDHDGEIGPEELVHYEWEVAPEIQVNSRWKRSREQAAAEAQQGANQPRAGNGRGRGGVEGYDPNAAIQGAARYALLNIPQPVAAADADLNRGITLAEFRQAASYRFRLLDTKRQGRLTLLELQALVPMRPKDGRGPKRKKDAPDPRVGVPLPPGD